MRTLLLAAVVLTSLAAGPAFCGDAPAATPAVPAAPAAPAPSAAQKVETAAAALGASLTAWFTHVKEGLAESSVTSRRQQARITAVAAVRGAGQDDVDPSQPVWKSAAAGKKSKALRAQRQELTEVVDAVLAGKLDEGRSKLDAFEKAHPDSPMLADAKDIGAKLDEAAKAQQDELAKAKAAKP